MAEYKDQSQYNYFFNIFFQNSGKGSLSLGLNPGWIHSHLEKQGVCSRARSIIPTGVCLVPARQVNHRIANIGQTEVTPNIKHDGCRP